MSHGEKLASCATGDALPLGASRAIVRPASASAPVSDFLKLARSYRYRPSGKPK
jgi:hypothetical protein